MEDTYLEESLEPLKKDLTLRPDKAQYLFNQHLASLNDCIDKRYSLNEIFNYLYGESEQTTFYYFKNLLYRARKKSKVNKIETITPIQLQKTERSVINETVEKPNTETTIIKQRQNPLANLEEPKDNNELHDSSSDLESLQARMARMLQEKENQK